MTPEDKIDFSSLDPSLHTESWEHRIHETAEQATLVRELRHQGQHPEILVPHARERHFEDEIARILDGVNRSQEQPSGVPVVGVAVLQRRVTEVAPRALAVASLLAAASWLAGVWVETPSQREAAAIQTPGISLASWAEQGRVPQTEEILALIGGSHGSR